MVIPEDVILQDKKSKLTYNDIHQHTIERIKALQGHIPTSIMDPYDE